MNDGELDDSSGFRLFRYDATGLRGKRLRLLADLPTNDAGVPQEDLIGVTDVISLDDTPSVLHSLRVHLVDDPAAIGIVGIDQLALYDERRS